MNPEYPTEHNVNKELADRFSRISDKEEEDRSLDDLLDELGE